LALCRCGVDLFVSVAVFVVLKIVRSYAFRRRALELRKMLQLSTQLCDNVNVSRLKAKLQTSQVCNNAVV
jgi:hypothetical protein